MAATTPNTARVITLERTTHRRPSPTKLVKQLEYVAGRILSGGRAKRWQITNRIAAPKPVRVGDSWKYRFDFNLQATKKLASTEREFEHIQKVVEVAAKSGNRNWITEKSLQGSSPIVSAVRNVDTNVGTQVNIASGNTVNINVSNQSTKFTRCKVDNDGEINLSREGFFDHLFGLDVQVDILISAAKTAVESNFKIRDHVLLAGDPSAGKTSLMKAFAEMVGEEHCYFIDSVSSTQAGVLNDLISRDSSPKWIMVEEIEKVNLDHLRWMLGVMDDRGEIRVCNSKVGYVQKDMSAMIVATVNDMEKLENTMAGALASRFSNKIHCPKISKSVLHQVVKKWVDMVDGDEQWIDPAIDYVQQFEQSSDPRRIKAVCLGGRERLLTGEYQQMLKATSTK